MMAARRSRPIWLGRDVDTAEDVYLSRQWLETHLHILGPPGSGKTRFLLWLYENLAREPGATVILLNPKGDLFHMARDFAVAGGLTKRLVVFDPGDPQYLIGYNPLRPNGLDVVAQAKVVREGIRSAWGQASFDQTPQLARFLLLALAAARAAELTLVEALGLLRAGRNPVRAAVIAAIADPWISDALAYFDRLGDRRQEELAASTVARLEAFVADPAIRAMLTEQRHTLDIGQIVEEQKLLLINLEQHRPLGSDDVRLLGRLMVNDILAHVFARPRGCRAPVYLLIDEAHMFVTHELCTILDQGRELGLHCIIAHQHLGQLREEETSGHLYESVMNCARTKIVFGGLAAKQLDEVTREILIDQFDPWCVKDEIRSLELDPVEELRGIVAEGTGEAYSIGLNTAKSRHESFGDASGNSEHWSVGGSRGEANSYGTSSGRNGIESGGEVLLPTGEILVSQGASDSTSDSSFDGNTRIATESWQSGGSRSTGRSRAKGTSRQSGLSIARSGITNRTVSQVPFHSYRKRRVVSSRTFLSEQEFLTLGLQRIKALPMGQCVVKTPSHRAVFLRLPLVRTPHVSSNLTEAARVRIFSQPFYRLRTEVRSQHSLELVKIPGLGTIKSIADADDTIIIHGRRRRGTGQS